MTVTAAAALSEGVESVLLDLGAPGLQVEDVAGGTRVTAHFAGAAPLAALDAALAALCARHPGATAPQVVAAAVGDEDWAENWKRHFPGLAIGARLFVHPPWVAPPADRLAVLLDPGMAFGTGQHASTRGCLALLEPALAGYRAARVLDLGCGSGILAIAAVKLGAAHAQAIDVDPEACAIAAENAARNGVADAIAIDTALAGAPGPFEIVLANLFARQLIELAAAIATRLAPGGLAIGAGVLAGEADAVRAAWTAAGLAPHGDWQDEGWVALAFRRPA